MSVHLKQPGLCTTDLREILNCQFSQQYVDQILVGLKFNKTNRHYVHLYYYVNISALKRWQAKLFFGYKQISSWNADLICVIIFGFKSRDSAIDNI